MKAVIYSLAGVLIVAGAAVAIASFLSPGQVIHGIDAGLAGVLLAGGAVTLGLAGLTEAVETFNHTLSRTLRLLDARATLNAEAAAATDRVEEAGAPFAAPHAEAEPAEPQPFGETTVAAERASLREDTPEAESQPETISGAARDTVEEASERTVETAAVVEEVAIAETPPAEPEAAAEAEAEAPTEELYVVEEREFRGKPARVLSDGTVEAETDEGWMRFENMEHLEEYMDAMDAQRS